MFNGGHTVIYSTDAAADREIFKTVLGFKNIDAGDGWLIFSLPPSELAFHPHENSTAHELYLMCDDLDTARQFLVSNGIECAEPIDEGWGILSSFVLPGGSSIGFYQPRHERP